MQTAAPTSRRWALVLALGYLALMVPLGLYPFVFQPVCRTCTNDVTLSPQGVHFGQTGIITDSGAGALLYDALAGTSEITLAVRLRSDGLAQMGPARIFSLSGSPTERNLTLGQERGDLVLRLRTPRTGPNGSRHEIIARDVIDPGRTQVIVATYDGRTARLFVDGQIVVTRPMEAGGFTNWDAGFPLVLGNEATGDRPWRGTLYDAEVHARALPPVQAALLQPGDTNGDDAGRLYRLRERCPVSRAMTAPAKTGACEIPDQIIVVNPPEVLDPGSRGVTDYLQNIALYLIPGALLFAGCGSRPPRRILLPALGHPLLIELLQAPVAGRTSSLQDGLSGWLGLALGGAAALWLIQRAGKAR